MPIGETASTRYVLGVDGGSSKTLAVLSDERGTVAGVGRTGSGSHQTIGLGPAMDQIRSAVMLALRMAGVQPAEVDAVYYCVAGADLPGDFELLGPALARLELGRMMGFNNDSIASLRAGTDKRNAVCVAVGSGTVAVGRNASGEEIRLPALGRISGDWGGGGDLAQEAIWHAARMHDGRGEPTLLHDVVLQALDLPDFDALIEAHYYRRIDRLAILHLAPLVFEAAEAGDSVARALIERQGIEVAVTAAALLRRLGILDAGADVVLGGSIFSGQGPLLIDTVRKHLRELAPSAEVVVLDVQPVIGALFCAMDLLHLRVGEGVRRRARESYGAVTQAKGEKVVSQ